MEGRPRYCYDPLTKPTSIRILLLIGGNGDNLIAKLTETDINSPVAYEALSYVWGNATKSHSILLLGGTSLPVTASLHSALRDIRHSKLEDGTRAIWADAVCINQEDLAERSQQVNMMTTIYRNARCVITYVGEDTTRIDIGINLAEKLIQYAKDHEGDSRDALNQALVTPFFEKLGLPALSDPAWKSLAHFLSRPWYTRMWIVQESVLNNNGFMLCGKKQISWELFTNLTDVLQKGIYPRHVGLVPTSERIFGALMQTPRIRKEYREDGMHISNLLISLRDLDCTDPRDRVFALAGLVKDVKITVNYEMTTSQVYTEVAVYLLRYGLTVLSFAGGQKAALVPSWVPDWSVPAGQLPVLLSCDGEAHGTTKTVIDEVNLQIGSLRLSAIIQDSIVHVTGALQGRFISARITRYEWARDQYLRLHNRGSYPTGGSYLEALWRTLVLDISLESRKRSSPDSYGNGFEAYVRPDAWKAKREALIWMAQKNMTGQLQTADPVEVAAWSREQFLSEDNVDNGEDNIFKNLRASHDVVNDDRYADDPIGREYRDAVMTAGNLYRRMFTTSNGYIGMICEEALVGDTVAFFPGASVPFILRQHGNDTEFRLVGDCYVYGLMDGEVFNNNVGGSKTITLV